MESTNISIEFNNLNKFCKDSEFRKHRKEVSKKIEELDISNELYKDSLGWLNPEKYTNVLALSKIDEVAATIKELGSVLVLIGIGGSNQGARAVIEALDLDSSCQIIWAGNNLSAHETKRVLNQIGNRDFSINVIAKNFKTVEPGLAFRIFRDALIKKYGKDYNKRVFCTGTLDSYFNQLCNENNFTFLEFPEDLGGRFSMFSNVGLLPIAVAGIDIHSLCSGLSNMATILPTNKELLDYVSFRTYFNKIGYPMEMMSFFEDRLFRFGKWWMQLIGESEGKNGKGIFPVIGNFSEDLHSLGQFIQEGTPLMFETFVKITNQENDLLLPKNKIEDLFDYANNKSLLEVNKISEMATIKAHGERLPVCVFNLKRLDEKTVGEVLYFYMFSTYISCLAININPFNQPGVELYKKWMFEGLNK